MSLTRLKTKYYRFLYEIPSIRCLSFICLSKVLHRLFQGFAHFILRLGVSNDCSNNQDDKEHQNDRKIGSKHAFVLLHGPTTSKEGNNDDEQADDDKNDGST